MTTPALPASATPRARKRLLSWAPVAIAIIAVIVAAALVLRPATHAPGLIGKAAPTFSLRSINGSTISLSSLRGHPVVLNFWGTSCPPCRREVPLLQQASTRYRDRGLVVIGLDSQLEDAQTISAFASERGVSYPMLLDPNGGVAPLYRVDALPHSFLIDRAGIIRADEPAPFLDVAPLDSALKAIL